MPIYLLVMHQFFFFNWTICYTIALGGYILEPHILNEVYVCEKFQWDTYFDCVINLKQRSPTFFRKRLNLTISSRTGLNGAEVGIFKLLVYEIYESRFRFEKTPQRKYDMIFFPP